MLVSQDVLLAIESAALDGPCLRLTAQLDRKAYEAVNKVLAAAGGAWNRKMKAHVFDGDAAEAVEPILLTGEVRLTKQEFGQFDTPLSIAARVIHEAGIASGMMVLEPSAGIGNIAVAAIGNGGIVHTVEIDPERNAKLVMRIAASHAPAAQHCTGQHADFLSLDPNPVYDRIVMNPPFAKQADIKHVLHALKFLKPDGKLVAIMSASVGFRTNRITEEFRHFVTERGGSIEPLPDDSFKEAGTAVRTVLVTISG